MHDVEFGTNRTGIASAVDRGEEMIEATRDFPPSAPGSADDLNPERLVYAGLHEPIGSVPRPTIEVSDSREILATRVLDKLSERIAFERAGVRLYDGLLAKHDGSPAYDGQPARRDLERIRNEELEHFLALCEVAIELGADPTAVTPSADLVGVIGEGVAKVIADPRTTLVDGLQAILVAELADSDGWELLIELMRSAGLDEVVEQFERFHQQEQEHVAEVRQWLGRAVLGEEVPTPH